MTKLLRSTTIRCLFFGVLVLAATSWAQTRPRIAEQIAKTYGLDSFVQIQAIRYTFNAQLPGVNVSRSWVWQPKTGQVSYEGKDKDGKPVKVTYVGSDNRVEEFVYHRGGPKKPSVAIATWAGYKKAGPLLISTDRRGTADGKPLRIFFSDVSVKLVGSDTWVNAK